MTRAPFADLLRIDGQITLRVTRDGATHLECPVSLGNTALLVAQGALFLRDDIQKLQTSKLNQQPKE